MWHISNKYFDLEPVVGRLAQNGGWKSRVRHNTNLDPQIVVREGVAPSVWAVLARSEAALGTLARDPRWTPLHTNAELWSDERSSLWPLLVAKVF